MVDTLEVVGDRRRGYVVAALVGLLLGASGAFLLGLNVVRGLLFFVPVLAIAAYAG